MYKILDILFNFNSGKKIDFEKGIYWGIIIFIFLLLLFSYIL
jgi:hypothetical protein